MELDKFYTKVDVAKKLINHIDLKRYDVIIEPSAGNGSFSKNIENCLAYDIEPEDASIIKQNFLTLEGDFKGKIILFIGNPPFGKRSSLAKKFISKSIGLGADTVAFILPKTFNKFSNQKVFPSNWKLVKVLELENSIFLIDKKDYYVPCSFYIWESNSDLKDLREVKQENCGDFIFLNRGNSLADFVLNGNSGKIKNVNEVTNAKAEHYIKEGNKTKEELINIFNKLDFDKLSSINGGNYWIGQQEILKAYNENKRYSKRN